MTTVVVVEVEDTEVLLQGTWSKAYTDESHQPEWAVRVNDPVDHTGRKAVVVTKAGKSETVTLTQSIGEGTGCRLYRFSKEAQPQQEVQQQPAQGDLQPYVWNAPSKPYHEKQIRAEHYYRSQLKWEQYEALPPSEKKKPVWKCPQCKGPVCVVKDRSGKQMLCKVVAKKFYWNRRSSRFTWDIWFYPFVAHECEK